MSLTRWRETGGEFQFRDHRIFVRDSGVGSEALLLLHGLPTASWDFEPIWPGLIKRYPRVLTLDLLGFGFSDKPSSFRYAVLEQADLVTALLTACGVTRVHVLAHDHGALVAQELLARARDDAASAPQYLSLTLLNPPLFGECYRPSPLQRLLLGPLAPLYLRLAGARCFARTFAALFGAETRPGLIELHDYWTLIGQRRGKHALRALYHGAAERRAQHARWLSALREAHLPICLIVGRDDRVAGPQMAERCRQLLPDTVTVLLDGIGHYPHVEAPDRTLSALRAFHERFD